MERSSEARQHRAAVALAARTRRDVRRSAGFLHNSAALDAECSTCGHQANADAVDRLLHVRDEVTSAKRRADHARRLEARLNQSTHHRSKAWRDAAALLVAARSGEDENDAATLRAAKAAVRSLAHEKPASFERRLLWAAHDPDGVWDARLVRHMQVNCAKTKRSVEADESRIVDNYVFATLDRHNNALLGMSPALYAQLYIDPYSFDPRSRADLVRLRRAQRGHCRFRNKLN